MKDTITLAQGNGGCESNELISAIFMEKLGNEILSKAEDAAVVDSGRIAISTDSFTVSPIFFSGGDIGKLSICGTCNDLAMMGAQPAYLTLGIIIEEGFAIDDLRKIVDSIAKELAINGAQIISGDTKVVPKGTLDQIIINTTGFGYVQKEGISASTLQKDDRILLSHPIGEHGATIFANREGIELQSALKSDCASLWPIVRTLCQRDIQIKAMRDATRGGLSAVLNEWAKASDVCIEVQEDAIPISDEVRGICELLGFDATALANEGTFVLAVDAKDANKALQILHSFEHSKEASIIGSVTEYKKQKVILRTPYNTSRYLEMPLGELLPRIC
jgi:hydrogenase expression/formation protein HypE